MKYLIIEKWKSTQDSHYLEPEGMRKYGTLIMVDK